MIRCLILEADSKENDKASAIRSKHSVTEQRRRSKINERYLRINRGFQAFWGACSCELEIRSKHDPSLFDI